MLPQSYTFSHGLCLNNFLQVLLICNQRDQVPPFRYINQDYKVSHLVIVMKLPGDMKYLMRSVKRAADAVGIWSEENSGCEESEFIIYYGIWEVQFQNK